MTSIVEKKKLKKGDIIEGPNGIKYIVTTGEDSLFFTAAAERQKARGGYIRHYGSGSFGGVRGPGSGTSDSIPAMLSNGEYVLNAAAVSKFGVPMLDQMNTAYNIPSGTFVNPSGMANNSYNNNVYNIDIALNGTNVTVDDVMNRFKSELALVNAKQGRVRTVGGQY